MVGGPERSLGVHSVLLAQLLTAAFASAPKPPWSSVEIEPAEGLQALFQDQRGDEYGWLGADVATSIQLPSSSNSSSSSSDSLFLFGDTLVGHLGPVGFKNVTNFPRNSVATLFLGNSMRRKQVSDTATVNFTWGLNERQLPATLFKPPNFSPASNWMWPLSGIFISDASPQSPNSSLLALGPRCSNDSSSSFGFRVAANAGLLIRDIPPGGPFEPREWANAQHYFELPTLDASKLQFGSFLVRNPLNASQVYIGGTSTYNVAGNQSNTVLARVSAAALLDQDWDAVEYLVNVSSSRSWQWERQQAPLQNPERLWSLFQPGGERSLHYSEYLQSWLSLGFTKPGGHIAAYYSPAIEGPWTKASFFSVPPFFNRTKQLFLTDVKLHPQFSVGAQDLVFTFLSNTWNHFPNAPWDAQVYIPQFFRATFSKRSNTSTIEGPDVISSSFPP